MFGVKQAGKIANRTLKARMGEDEYYECKHTPGLCQHSTRPIWFSLVIDNIFVSYINHDNAMHLVKSLEKHYELKTDWEAKIFCGVHLKWDYMNRICDISMPGYVKKALQCFTMRNRHDVKIPRTPGSHRTTAPKHNSQQNQTKARHSPTHRKSAFKKSLECFCGALELSSPQCL